MSLGELKDKIKEYPLSHVIGLYIDVVKKGQNYVALCPWHDDTNPSLTITDSKGLFRCWACDIGGDHLSFAQRYSNLEFKEAILEVGNKLGLQTQDYQSNKNANPQYKLAEKVCAKAAQIYFKLGQTQRYDEYNQFIKQRNISGDSLNQFKIGFAPGNNAFLSYLNSIEEQKEKNNALQMAQQLGLLKQYNGQLQDTFRNRIIFPIWDSFGKTIGFTSRATQSYQKAKYLNSPESMLFHKKNVVYGLNFARSSIRHSDSALLVEGQMDCIAMHQSGFTNTVAISGIGIGDHPIQVLTQMTKNIYLALDSDQAGHKALMRLGGLLLQKKIVARCIEVGPSKDPDEFLQSFGRLALTEKMESSPSFLDVGKREIIPAKIPQVMGRKLELLEQFFALASPMNSHLLAQEKVLEVANELGLKSGPEEILKAYQRFLQEKNFATKTSRPSTKVTSPLAPEALDNGGPQGKTASEGNSKNQDLPVEPPKLTPTVRSLLQNLVQNPHYLGHEEMAEILDFLGNSKVQPFITKLIELYYETQESEFPQLVLDSLGEDGHQGSLRDFIGGCLFNYRPHEITSRQRKKFFNDIMIKLNIEALKEKRESIRKEQSHCHTELEACELMGQLIQIEKKLNALKLGSKSPPI